MKIEEWISQFKKSESTKNSYQSYLKGFAATIEEDLDEYLENLTEEQATKDFKNYLEELKNQGKSSGSIRTYLTVVKQFINEVSNTRIPDNIWAKMRRREMPTPSKETRDKAGSYEEWEMILRNMNPKGRSLYLFLLSSGCRIGETMGLEKEDIELDSNPPEAYMRKSTTKSGRPRIVYFSDEASQEIERWLERRKNLTKRSSGKIPEFEHLENLSEGERKEIKENLKEVKNAYQTSSKLWPFTPTTARRMLYNAIEKSGIENGKDSETDRRKLHPHSTRKFYKTNCKLEDDIRNALLGHLSKLDKSYNRVIENGEASREYEDKMHNLMFFESAKDMPKIREELEDREEEQKALIERLKSQEDKVQKLEGRIENLELEIKKVNVLGEFLEKKGNLEDIKEEIESEINQ